MSAGAIRAGRAFVELTSDDSQLQAGLRRAQARFRQFGASVQRIGTGVAAAGTAVLGPMLAMTRHFGQVGDDLHKMAGRTGVAVESLSELGFAAEQSGASMDDVGKAIQRMNRRLGRDLDAGEGSTLAALEQLGLSADELEKMRPEDRFLAIADAMANYGDDAAAAGLAQRAFGAGVDALIPTLMEGRDGIEALREQARDAGFVMSGEMAESAAEMQDAMNLLQSTVRGVSLQIGAALAPAITDVATRLQEFLPDVIRWIRENQDLVVTIAQVAAGVVGLGTGLIALGTGIRMVGALFWMLAVAAKAVGVIFTFLAAHPIVFAIGALAVAVAALVAAFNQGNIAGINLYDTLGRLISQLDAVHRATQRLVDANERVTEAQRERRLAEEELAGAENEEERIAALQRLQQALQAERQAQRDRHREQQRERRQRLDAARDDGDFGQADRIQSAIERGEKIAEQSDRRRRERIREIAAELQDIQQTEIDIETPDVSDLQDELDSLATPDIDDIDMPDLGKEMFDGFESEMRRSGLGDQLGRQMAHATEELQQRRGAFAAFDPSALAAQFFGAVQGRVDRKIESNTKQIARNTKQIARRLQRTQPTFG